MFYMEDYHTGQSFTAGPRRVEAADILAFATDYDPQPFHLDEAAAQDTLFGGLIASGWHTAALTMRLMLAALPAMPGGMIGRRIESLDWPHPVRPGDSLSVRCDVLDLKPTRHPARGVMRLRTVTTIQSGERVLDMQALIFVPRRPADAKAENPEDQVI